MTADLRPPLAYSNWVWLLGAVLVLIAIGWVVTLVILYRVRLVRPKDSVRTLGELQRRRYRRHIGEVEDGYRAGMLPAREAHFALATLIRAAATEKTGVNVESQTAEEAAANFPQWPQLAVALTWCEDETFPADRATQQVEHGVALARGVIER